MEHSDSVLCYIIPLPWCARLSKLIELWHKHKWIDCLAVAYGDNRVANTGVDDATKRFVAQSKLLRAVVVTVRLGRD